MWPAERAPLKREVKRARSNKCIEMIQSVHH
jgi:hypothetical protein